MLNSFTGSLDGICSNGIAPAVFVADCHEQWSDLLLLYDLLCQTDNACNEMVSSVSLDPSLENSFQQWL
jgi:hypothetical protein